MLSKQLLHNTKKTSHTGNAQQMENSFVNQNLFEQLHGNRLCFQNQPLDAIASILPYHPKFPLAAAEA